MANMYVTFPRLEQPLAPHLSTSSKTQTCVVCVPTAGECVLTEVTLEIVKSMRIVGLLSHRLQRTSFPACSRTSAAAADCADVNASPWSGAQYVATYGKFVMG